MVQETPRRCFYNDMLALSPHIELVERLYRAVGLAMYRSESGEIMKADQPLRGAMHGFCIKWLRDAPCLSRLQRQRGAAIGNAIFIGATDARKARVPIVRHDYAIEDRHRMRAEQRIDPLHQAEGFDGLVEFGVRAHRQRMDARIGATSGVQNGVFAGHFANGILNRLLH